MSSNHILTGLGSIVNIDNIKPGINLRELEKQLIGGSAGKVADPADRLNQELKNTAKSLGITLGGANDDNVTFKPTASDHETQVIANDDEYDDDDKPTDFAPAEYKPTHLFARQYKNDDLTRRTFEQQRKSQIDNVMGTDEDAQFSFEKEKKEDIKISMLSEIDSLYSTLSEEDVDLTRIPQVNRLSTFEEVESVLKNLRHKNDHIRYCTFAEEMMMNAAHALEELFDGKKLWFGRYKPDLTGWHNHVNVKLRRMRHDTGQIVGGVMDEFNVGPTARIMLELVPSMILYSKSRKQQHNRPNMTFTDDEMDAARERIRNIK